MFKFLRDPLTRRTLAGAMLAGILVRPAAAETDTVGEAADVRGKVIARRTEAVRDLANGAGLRLRDSVETDIDSFARLDFAGRTIVRLGSRARLMIDRFVAEAGGELELGDGALLFDRADELPKIDVGIRSRFGLIAVRGTRFFAGPNRGVFAVFVDRGSVEVSAAGVTRSLQAGEGLDIPSEGAPPGEVKTWGKARIAEAFASVGL